MDNVIRLGPLVLALDRVVALAAIWAFLALASVIASRTNTPAERASWIAAALGLIAARIGFVIANWPAYAAEPWSILALWQGGFLLWPGLAAAAVALLIQLKARPAAASLASLGTLAAVWLALSNTILQTPPNPLPNGLQVVALSGQPLDLDTMKGRPYVINLWATWCPPCRRELPMLIDAAKSAKIPVLLANQGETPRIVSAYLAKQGLPETTIYLDIASRIGAKTGSKALPTTLFVNAEGLIRTSHSGEISRAALLSGIAALEDPQK